MAINEALVSYLFSEFRPDPSQAPPRLQPFAISALEDIMQHVCSLRHRIGAAPPAPLDFRCGNLCDGVCSPFFAFDKDADQIIRQQIQAQLPVANKDSDTIRQLMKINPRIPFHDRKYLQWNRAPFYGFHVRGYSDNLKDAFVEIQYKRVSGADLPLLQNCGVDCRVFHVLRVQRNLEDNSSYHRRLERSFVYLVRIVGSFAGPGSLVNFLQGPPENSRRSLTIGMGGWVAPPHDERAAILETTLRNSVLALPAAARIRRCEVLQSPRPRPATLATSSDSVAPNVDQSIEPELWLRQTDPTQDDVMWMAWKLLTGTTYRGFRPGVGIDFQDPSTKHYLGLIAAENPFPKPSETVYHTLRGMYQERDGSQATSEANRADTN